ncbi:Sin-like protein conserved region-domain-containing protein, partial [Blyttiomyces helicus]
MSSQDWRTLGRLNPADGRGPRGREKEVLLRGRNLEVAYVPSREWFWVPSILLNDLSTDSLRILPKGVRMEAMAAPEFSKAAGARPDSIGGVEPCLEKSSGDSAKETLLIKSQISQDQPSLEACKTTNSQMEGDSDDDNPKRGAHQKRAIVDEDDEMVDVDPSAPADPMITDAAEEGEADTDEVTGEDEQSFLEADEDDDPDDPIINRIPVYLSQSLTGALHVFQFPTRTEPFSEPGLPTVGRMKPKSLMFQLDVPLDSASENYDKEMGQDLGAGVTDGRLLTLSESRSGAFTGKTIDTEPPLVEKIVYRSSILPANATYMAGYIDNKALHLTPVEATFQLRPHLDYIDRYNDKKAKLHKDEDAEKPSKGSEPKLIQRTIKAKDADSERLDALASMRRLTVEEPWVEVKITHPESDASNEKRASLIVATDSQLKLISNASSYLDEVYPKAESSGPTKSKVKVEYSRTYLDAMPLVERLQSLLMHERRMRLLSGALTLGPAPSAAHVVTFKDVMQAIGTQEEEAEVAKALSGPAVLVNGVWVAKSELLYSGRIADARRYLLSLFDKGDHVSRGAFTTYVTMDGIQLLNMMREIAVLDEGKGWRLKVDADNDFMRRFPEIVQEQRKEVEAHAQRALVALGKAEASGPVVMEESTTAFTAPLGKLSHKEYPVDGKTIDEQLLNILRRLFARHNLLSLDFIMKSVFARKGDA